MGSVLILTLIGKTKTKTFVLVIYFWITNPLSLMALIYTISLCLWFLRVRNLDSGVCFVLFCFVFPCSMMSRDSAGGTQMVGGVTS